MDDKDLSSTKLNQMKDKVKEIDLQIKELKKLKNDLIEKINLVIFYKYKTNNFINSLKIH